jgi:hypothetical protein
MPSLDRADDFAGVLPDVTLSNDVACMYRQRKVMEGTAGALLQNEVGKRGSSWIDRWERETKGMSCRARIIGMQARRVVQKTLREHA